MLSIILFNNTQKLLVHRQKLAGLKKGLVTLQRETDRNQFTMKKLRALCQNQEKYIRTESQRVTLMIVDKLQEFHYNATTGASKSQGQQTKELEGCYNFFCL